MTPCRRTFPASTKPRSGPPLHWMLLTTEGGAGIETARTVLRWYGLRWRTGRFFHALRQGTRIEDRRLDHADGLRKCLAVDAITAFMVWDLSLLARERPDGPATSHVTRQDVTALHGSPPARIAFMNAFAVMGTSPFHFPLVGSKPPTSSRILLQLERIVLWPCPSGNEPPVQGKGSFPEGQGHAI